MSRAVIVRDAKALAVAYDRARTALAELKAIPVDELTIDQALTARDAGELIKVTAHQARDRQMEIDAVEIRMRAERRLGELLAAQKATAGLNAGTRGQLRGRGVIGGSQSAPPIPKLVHLGIDRKLSSEAQQLARIPKRDFEQKLTAWRGRLERGTERVSRAIVRNESKAEHRAGRELELAKRQRALPAQRYGVVLADPEWRFEVRSRATGLDRSADNHYPTSSTEEICGRPIASIAADDCVLFLWATAPMMPDALRVMAAWGFAYRSQVVWIKPAIGTGYWFRNRHELLLVGTRGGIPAPAPGTQYPSAIEAPTARHSEKPAIFYELIERYFPNLPKIELNARMRRPGWDAWGNEAPELEQQSETLRQPREGSRLRPKTSRLKRAEIARAGMPARVQRSAHRAGASRPANSKRRGSQ